MALGKKAAEGGDPPKPRTKRLGDSPAVEDAEYERALERTLLLRSIDDRCEVDVGSGRGGDRDSVTDGDVLLGQVTRGVHGDAAARLCS